MFVKESGDGMADIKKALAFFKENRCLVGIPQAKGPRTKGEITNVELAFIHSFGSPKRNIPARPFIEPAIAQADVKQKIAERMKAAAMQAIDGDADAALVEMHKAGQYGENAVKDYIGSSNLVPNSPETIRLKGSDAPLIDTGSLRSSVTHVIERK